MDLSKAQDDLREYQQQFAVPRLLNTWQMVRNAVTVAIKNPELEKSVLDRGQIQMPVELFSGQVHDERIFRIRYREAFTPHTFATFGTDMREHILTVIAGVHGERKRLFIEADTNDNSRGANFTRATAEIFDIEKEPIIRRSTQNPEAFCGFVELALAALPPVVRSTMPTNHTESDCLDSWGKPLPPRVRTVPVHNPVVDKMLLEHFMYYCAITKELVEEMRFQKKAVFGV